MLGNKICSDKVCKKGGRLAMSMVSYNRTKGEVQELELLLFITMNTFSSHFSCYLLQIGPYLLTFSFKSFQY